MPKMLDILAPSVALALRAIGCADVRLGVLPSQSGLRRNDELDSRSLRAFSLPTGVIIRAAN
jgi:hypothetical protein